MLHPGQHDGKLQMIRLILCKYSTTNEAIFKQIFENVLFLASTTMLTFHKESLLFLPGGDAYLRIKPIQPWFTGQVFVFFMKRLS